MNGVIFWDFDGTLVYKNKSFLESLMKALEGEERRPSADVCQAYLLGTCSWNFPEKSYTDCTGEDWWADLLDKTSAFLKKNGIPECRSVKICEQFRKNVVTYPYVLYEDAEEILSYAKEKGYRNYILSNNFPELVRTVERFGLDRLFTDCFLSTDIGYEKPRVEIFEYALRHAGNPERVYMVGDNPEADIKGAAKAGIHTVLVHPDGAGKNGNKEADDIFQTLAEIKVIL